MIVVTEHGCVVRFTNNCLIFVPFRVRFMARISVRIEYCRLGIYRATKISRKANFLVFHMYLFREGAGSTARSIEPNSDQKMQTFGSHLAAITWQRFSQRCTGKYAIYDIIPW